MSDLTIVEEGLMNKHDFYFEVPLYKWVEVSNLEKNLFENEVDAYSSKNSSDTTYSIEKIRLQTLDGWCSELGISTGYFFIKLNCKRKEDDILRFFILLESERICKLGQWPSMADLQFAEMGKKYDKVLPDADLKNLKKAVGLVTHGVGAGSFVYLRRIFENLIFETFENNSDQVGIAEADFKTQRMMDKVETLKNFLPPQLVEMKSIYSILSNGVHELSEEDCLRYFAPLKLSIELILDQKIEMLQKQQKDAQVKKQLQEISQQIAKKEKLLTPPTSL